MAEERKKSRRSFRSLPRRAQNAAFASMRQRGKVKGSKNYNYNKYITGVTDPKKRMFRNMNESRAISSIMDITRDKPYKTKKEAKLYKKMKSISDTRSPAYKYLDKKRHNAGIGKIYEGLIAYRKKRMK